ncbi:uncharacterized protein LOC113292615 [Papaver somniferum]|uniref:uncharacterized protein LOC113292615 n=1 Tax=Papaver somniferum TaxID=3469 RepID=UPI000E6FCAA5|nr:uncharacterized protein LOC113292615 [Papaver somniferum]
MENHIGSSARTITRATRSPDTSEAPWPDLRNVELATGNLSGNDRIDVDSNPGTILLAVCSTFVKNYQVKITISSTTATKVYANIDILVVIEMQEKLKMLLCTWRR